MNFNQQFKAFHPQSGEVPYHPFSTLPSIAWRARVLLRSLTTEQIESIAKRIESEIHEYFRHLKDDAISRLQSALEGGNTANEKYFERDNDAQANGRWLFKDEMVSELDILTAENSSEVDALRAVIEMRDYRGHTTITLPIPKRYPEGSDYQLFAVQSLWLLADVLNTLNKKRADLSVAGDYALKAMDAVCYSEHLYEAAWLVSYTERENEKEKIEEMIKQKNEYQERLREQERFGIENARRQKSEHAKRMNEARYKKQYEVEQLVIDEWNKNRNEFTSGEKAGEHFADWLETQNIFKKYNESQDSYEFYTVRTVKDWILKYAREIGFRFR
jgi:hypothetical protein